MSLADVLGFSQAQDWQGPCKFSLQDMIPGFSVAYFEGVVRFSGLLQAAVYR